MIEINEGGQKSENHLNASYTFIKKKLFRYCYVMIDLSLVKCHFFQTELRQWISVGKIENRCFHSKWR